jgi:RHS repeat-associated protein
MNGRRFQYDAEGKLQADGLRVYRWNDRDQLLETYGPEGSVSYSYDAFKRRNLKNELGSDVKYLWDKQNVARTIIGSSATDYLFGLSLDDIWSSSTGNITTEYQRDRLNNVITLVGPEGLKKSIAYDEYGRSQQQPTAMAQFGFTGNVEDVNGLVQLRFRYYDPMLGKFISEDFHGSVTQDSNFYTYSSNDPVTLSDPLGLDSHFELLDGIQDTLKKIKDGLAVADCYRAFLIKLLALDPKRSGRASSSEVEQDLRRLQIELQYCLAGIFLPDGIDICPPKDPPQQLPRPDPRQPSYTLPCPQYCSHSE